MTHLFDIHHISGFIGVLILVIAWSIANSAKKFDTAFDVDYDAHPELSIEELQAALSATVEQRDILQARLDYYQDFCKAHGARGITDAIVQRDKMEALVRKLIPHLSVSMQNGANIELFRVKGGA